MNDTLPTAPATSTPAPAPVAVAAKPAPAAARKPRPQPARNARVVEPATPDTDGWWCLAIDLTTSTKRHTRTETTTYLVCEVPAEGMGRGCRGFMLEKLSADLATVEVYNTLLHPDGSGVCTCMGHESHGRCKHRSALAALRAADRLPTPAFRSTADLARNDPASYDEWSRREAERWSNDYADAPPGPFDEHNQVGDAWEGPEPDAAA